MSSYAYPRQLLAIGKNRVAANAEVETTAFVDSNKQGLDHLLNPLVGRIQDVKLCLVSNPIGIGSISGFAVRWKYQLRSVWVPTDGSANVYNQYALDPQDSTTFDGYNLYEWSHVVNDLTGDGSVVLTDWIADGNTITPINGLVFAYAVRMNWKTTSPSSGGVNGDIIWLFDRPNGYCCEADGSCQDEGG
jgi:hypothetical protein